jgi:hypothetical protein
MADRYGEGGCLAVDLTVIDCNHPDTNKFQNYDPNLETL